MQGTLTIITQTLGYSDPDLTGANNDPKKKNVDWGNQITVTAKNISNQPYSVDPGASLTLYNNARTITADATTQWTLALSTLSSNRYRFTVSGGTAAGLRTDRSLAMSTKSVTVTVNANQTATFAATATTFSAVQVGDTLWIPGTTTGDTAGPFDPTNEGAWTVLSVAGDGSNFQASRGTNTFSGLSQTVTVTANAQFDVFSGAGVQIGDGVYVSAGFSSVVQRGYTVVQVTPTWFEVTSTATLPVSAIATPGATGIQFYQTAKRYIEIWADQECVVRLNGDTTDNNKVSPWQAGDITQAGSFAKAGIAWQAVVVNKSTATLNINVILAE